MNKQQYEYKAVYASSVNDVANTINKHTRGGWRFVWGTREDQYGVRLLLERVKWESSSTHEETSDFLGGGG